MNPTIEYDNVLKVIILRNFFDPTEEIERLKKASDFKGWEIWICVKKVEKIKL
jgi:hypothetical protein